MSPPDWEKKDECYIHGHEPIPEKYYKICGECWHVFVTSDELIQAYMDNCPGPKPASAPVVEEIHFCPHCTHDF